MSEVNDDDYIRPSERAGMMENAAGEFKVVPSPERVRNSHAVADDIARELAQVARKLVATSACELHGRHRECGQCAPCMAKPILARYDRVMGDV